MFRLLKNYLFQNNCFQRVKWVSVFIFVVFFLPTIALGQIANYVVNGSFEKKYDCNYPPHLSKAIGWNPIGNDTSKFGSFLQAIDCYSNAPVNAGGFQYPRSGNTYYRMQVFCTNPCAFLNSRLYPKNRLKATLSQGKTYCVKMYVSLQNYSSHAVSNLDFLLTDNSIDTIKYYSQPLSYLNPQVKNPNTNIITDTLNWVTITGTFVATGTEKYMVLGNFETNAGTTSSLVDTSFGSSSFAVYYVDDVSCIELGLPAYAGPDQSMIAGDSVYIGRESDFAIDPGCTWFQLPGMIPLDTISGMWVKPISTTTYVVRQILDCSSEKWDTVVVYMNLVGLDKIKYLNEDLRIYPVPANDFVELKVSNFDLIKDFKRISIYNNLGVLIREEEILFDEKKISLKINDLAEGVYSLQLKSINKETVSKRFMISR